MWWLLVWFMLFLFPPTHWFGAIALILWLCLRLAGDDLSVFREDKPATDLWGLEHPSFMTRIATVVLVAAFLALPMAALVASMLYSRP